MGVFEVKNLWSRFILAYTEQVFTKESTSAFLTGKELVLIVEDNSDLSSCEDRTILMMQKWLDLSEEERSQKVTVLEPVLAHKIINYLVQCGAEKCKIHHNKTEELETEHLLQLKELREEMTLRCDEKLNDLAIKKNKEMHKWKLTALAWKNSYHEAIKVMNCESKTPLILIALLRLYRSVPAPYKSLVGQIHFYAERVLNTNK